VQQSPGQQTDRQASGRRTTSTSPAKSPCSTSRFGCCLTPADGPRRGDGCCQRCGDVQAPGGSAAGDDA
jgi:hypothetical protein